MWLSVKFPSHISIHLFNGVFDCRSPGRKHANRKYINEPQRLLLGESTNSRHRQQKLDQFIRVGECNMTENYLLFGIWSLYVQPRRHFRTCPATLLAGQPVISQHESFACTSAGRSRYDSICSRATCKLDLHPGWQIYVQQCQYQK